MNKQADAFDCNIKNRSRNQPMTTNELKAELREKRDDYHKKQRFLNYSKISGSRYKLSNKTLETIHIPTAKSRLNASLDMKSTSIEIKDKFSEEKNRIAQLYQL